jgi:hypothetical protein
MILRKNIKTNWEQKVPNSNFQEEVLFKSKENLDLNKTFYYIL